MVSNRSMVQAYYRGPNGSIQFCYVHDLLHDLAVRKAEENNFLTVSSYPDDQKSCSGARRVAFHHGKYDDLMKDASPNLRSLLCFNGIPNLSKHRQLKVLSHMEKDWRLLPKARYIKNSAKGNRDLPKDRWARNDVLVSLRYLQLNTVDHFQLFVGARILNFLQTLDLRCAEPFNIPECIWYIKTLRHILLPDNYGQWTLGPPPLVDMKNLQTLCNVKYRSAWQNEGLPNLPCLRELCMEVHVEDTESQLQLETIFTLIDTLKQLKTLNIRGLDLKEENMIRNKWKHVYFTGDFQYKD
ncbi:hypothetical protein LUZ61_020771 [Rhynchospora tenuis]|uniref:Disease resistance R13L4/SHOC-2-like LRR domain-containing protein n=1 Tax=Rhynchospora tenuis TaxID=198213 RepID=A0AAD6EP53_9POAL|nr:hypothetical protein LUZ61_020771 [Rhynchospora tenuis]